MSEQWIGRIVFPDINDELKKSALTDRIAQLDIELAEARKVIGVVDGLVTAKGRYHTAQWYQKMVTALDEYKAAIKEIEK